MQGNYIEAQEILNATNGGLEIIFMLYPEARGSETRQNKKFKIREEKSASASLKRADDGNWLVTDFGGDQTPRNGVQCWMLEKGTSWVESIRELAAIFNIIPDERKAELISAAYSSRAATPDEPEGKWDWQVKTTFSDMEIETIISKKVLSGLGWKKPVSGSSVNAQGELKLSVAEEEKLMEPYNRIRAAFQEYHWHPLISYSIVKDRKVHTFSSTDTYPMFLIDEGTHQKIYQPKHPDKSKRFLYAGTKPKDFIHGMDQLSNAFDKNKKLIDQENNDDAEEDDRAGEGGSSKKKKEKDPRLPEVILCSGGSDAINVALLGYRVIWMNSETAKLYQYQYDKIMIRVQKFYQLPDIDATGKRAAHDLNMEYLEIFCIELPEDLKLYRDQRGNPCKDVRDYLNYYSRKDFRTLVEAALPYRFWEKKPRYEGRGDNKFFTGFDYEFDNVQAYNFLAKNGFGRLSAGDKKTDWMYVRRIGNIVYEQHPNDIKNFIHSFLRERLHDKNLRNSMFRTTQLSEGSLSNLDLTDIDFTDCTKDSQFVFFTNLSVEVTGSEIKYHKPGSIERYIWEDDLLQHRLEKPKVDPFTITRDELGGYDIVVNNTDCPFIKFLVQTSRVHWRKELEERITTLLPAEQEKYVKDNHCTLTGALLTDEEIEEQKAHLVNKIFAMGFLMHRYKARNKGWFVWGMDNKINDDGKSHGGSGKSIIFDMAMRFVLRKNFYINGRNPKLTDDPHKYDGLSEHHRYLLVDDAHEYLKLDSFYTDITGDINVNPKGKKPFSIPFEKSGKFAFTTNYTPRDLGPSTERRMVYTVFSDYYHNKGESDDYKELRDPKIDLGLTLFTDFDQKQWNDFYQAMLHSLKFFLSTDEKIKPAMENVNKRNLLSVMGNLHDWALVYFSEKSGKLDTFFVREEAYKDYITFNGSKITPQFFLVKMKGFCRYYGYVLNPKEYQDKHGKIIQKVEAKVYVQASNTWESIPNAQKVSKEMFYIQTLNELKNIAHDEPAADAPGVLEDLPF